MTAAERADIAARKLALDELIDQERRSERRTRIQATWIMVGFAVVFAAIAVGNLATGHRDAALAAAAGVLVFSAYTAYVARRRPVVVTGEAAELARVEETLARGVVHVYDIQADAAFVLTEQPVAEPFGYVLRVDPDRYVYVRTETCAGLDPEQLPNTRLAIQRTEPLGLCRAEAHGAPIVLARRIVIAHDHADEELATDLVDLAAPWDELATRLARIRSRPRHP